MMYETPRVVVHMLDDQGCLTSSKVIEQDPMDVACDTLMDIEDVVTPRTPENIIVTSELSLDSGQDITDLDVLRPDNAEDSPPAAKNDKPKVGVIFVMLFQQSFVVNDTQHFHKLIHLLKQHFRIYNRF